MNKATNQMKKVFLSILIGLLLLSFHNSTVLADTPTPPPTAGTLTCYSDSSVFDCVQIDPYTVRWNVIGNPYDNGNITGQFSVQYPDGPVYVTAHWSYALWVSVNGTQTNPKGQYGIVGSSGVYVNDGGSGTVCSHNLNQLCGNYPLGTWDFLQNAVTDSSSRATVGFNSLLRRLPQSFGRQGRLI